MPASKFEETRRVVVTGLGTVTPLGNNVAETWGALCDGVSGIGTISQFDAGSFPVRIAGEVDYENARDVTAIPDGLNRGAAFGLIAASEAIKASNRESWPESRGRIGVVLGCGHPGPDLTSIAHLLRNDPSGAREALRPQPVRNRNFDAGAVAIAELADAGGLNLSIYTACSSGAQAVGEGANAIRQDRADLIIAGGYDSMVNELSLIAFSKLGVLAGINDEPQSACRPFDRDRKGLVLGEGAGILILEERNHALNRGAEILAEFSGFGVSMNAYRVTDPDPQANGPVSAIQSALNSAGLESSSIDYVNTHGTATWANDPLETLAIKRVFGSSVDKLAASSTKSMTGHLMAAAGAVESVISVLVLRDQMAPPTINLENPDPRCDLDYVALEARSLIADHVLNNSFGFGGVNVATVFSKS